MNNNFEGDLRTDSGNEEEEEISDLSTVNPSWLDAPQQLCIYLSA